jgi:hypothetical protein
MKWSRSAEGTEVRCLPGFGFIRRPQGRQQDSRNADAEFLQRSASGHGLSQAFGQFIEFVVHKPFDSLVNMFSSVATGNRAHDYKESCLVSNPLKRESSCCLGVV